jgi:hypothetical protein
VRLDAAALFIQVKWGAANQSAARIAGRAKYRGESMAVSVMEQRFALARNDDTTQPPAQANLTFSEAKAELRKIRRSNPIAFRLMQVIPQKQKVER